MGGSVYLGGMVARAAALLLGVLALAGVLGSASAQDPGSVGGGPPPPPPPADPAAGAPAFLAHSEGGVLLLDSQGRVARVPPRSAERVVACPGSRRIVETGDWSGALRLKRLDGRSIWRQRIPIQGLAGVACLDPEGRRVAVVTESDKVPTRTLRIVSRRGVRAVLRIDDETPLLTRDRLYLTSPDGLEVRTLPGANVVRRLPEPPSAHEVMPSPDGRLLAMTHLTEALRFRSWLVEARTGAVRRISIPRMTVLGWVAKDRLAVRSDRKLRILDPSLRERSVIDGFRSLRAAITRSGEIVTTDGTALVAVRRGSDRIERIGTVPEGVYLDSALR